MTLMTALTVVVSMETLGAIKIWVPGGGMHSGGPTGDTVEYQGEFDRYIVTTVSGDELASSGLVSDDFISRIDALDPSGSTYLVAETKITVVQDTVTGKIARGLTF